MAHFIRDPVVVLSNPTLTRPVEIEQEPEALPSAGADGTNLRLWPTSMCLSEWCCEHAAEFIVGKRIVELGAGAGAVGLVCAALGASSVTLTDVPDALPLIERNVERNPPPPGTTVRVLPCMWGDADHVEALLRDEAEEEGRTGYDIILCCEVVYQQSAELLSALAHTQRALARSQHAGAGMREPAEASKVLLAYEYRSGLSEDLAYFDAATELFGECTSHALDGAAAQAHMKGGVDDGGDDRFLYIYHVPPPQPAATTRSGGARGGDAGP